MLYLVNGKLKTKEQTINKVWNQFIKEYHNQRKAKDKKLMIADIIDEIEYINYYNNDESLRDKELYDLLRSYEIEQKLFTDSELRTIFSIVENMNIIRN